MRPGRATAPGVVGLWRVGTRLGWTAASLWLGATAAQAQGVTPPAPGAADAANWQFSARSEHHSDALPLAALGGDDWQRLAPRRGRNLAYVDDELRLSRQQGGWTWSLLARSQATLVASADALALAASVAGRQPPAADASWHTDLRLRGFSGAGAALGRRLALAPGWTWQVEAQALVLARWRERQLQGPVQYNAADGRYSFGLQSTDTDNRLDFPFRQPVAAQGTALLLATSLAWDGPKAWASAGLHDGGWLHWRGLPQQLARLDTATASVDADGFLIYQPLIQGRNRQDQPTQRQPWRGTLAAGARLSDGQRLGLQLDSLPGWGLLPTLVWQRPATTPGALSLGAEWHLHERRLDLSLAWQGLSLRAGSDRLGAGAQSRALAVGWTGRF